jgi:hypothetical protein
VCLLSFVLCLVSCVFCLLSFVICLLSCVTLGFVPYALLAVSPYITHWKVDMLHTFYALGIKFLNITWMKLKYKNFHSFQLLLEPG